MKKCNKIISFLLSFALLLSFLIPVNAFAYEQGTNAIFLYQGGTLLKSVINNPSESVSHEVILDKTLNSSIDQIRFRSYFSGTFKNNEIYTFNLTLFNDEIKSFNLGCDVYDISNTSSYSSSNLVYSKSLGNVSLGTNNDNCSFSEVGSNKVISIKNIDLKTNVQSKLAIFIYCRNVTYDNIALFDVGVSNYIITSSDKSNSFLSSIIDYIKNIFSKLTELPNAIGSFITNLGNQISGFFTNLVNNLKTWFESVGNWFTELGNNIKQWFTNLTNNLKQWFDNIGKWFSDLWQNISDLFNNVIESVNNWWDSVVEWFHNLFIVPDGYMQEYLEKMQNWFAEHFGFLYQSITIFDTIINSFVIVFNGEGSGVINIPEIRLPFGNYVILHSTTFSFDEMINSHSQLKWVFNMIRTMSSAILLITFLNYSKNKFNEVIKNRQENDG